MCPFNTLLKLFPEQRNDISNVVKACIVCPFARQVRIPFSLSTSRISNAFDLIHMNLWGHYKIATGDGYKFFQLLSMFFQDIHRYTCYC